MYHNFADTNGYLDAGKSCWDSVTGLPSYVNIGKVLWHFADGVDWFHYGLLLPVIYLCLVYGLLFRPLFGLSVAMSLAAFQLPFYGCPLRLVSDALCRVERPGFDAFATSNAHLFWRNFYGLEWLRFPISAGLLALAAIIGASGGWNVFWPGVDKLHGRLENLTHEAWHSFLSLKMVRKLLCIP